MEYVDLLNKRFGYLTVIKLNKINGRGVSWVCKCDCGNEIVLKACYLIGREDRKPNKSCGCHKYKQSGNSVKHDRIYRVWKSMEHRCYNEKHTSYDRYGAKGVTVCDEWLSSFDAFLEWSLSNNYQEDLTIDRIDSCKQYSPDNCRWVDYFVQNKNKGISKNNVTGYKGVCKKGSQFRAYMRWDGINRHLGIYDTVEEASIARKNAENEYYVSHELTQI